MKKRHWALLVEREGQSGLLSRDGSSLVSNNDDALIVTDGDDNLQTLVGNAIRHFFVPTARELPNLSAVWVTVKIEDVPA